MSKVFQGMVSVLKRYSLSIGVLSLALIIVGTHFATAQQGGNNNGNSLGSHHEEFTLTAAPGELVYIPIPKVNFPIHVQISNRISGSYSGGFTNSSLMTSFTLADLPGTGVSTTYPETMMQNRQMSYVSRCEELGELGAKEAFAGGDGANPGGYNNIFDCLNSYDTNPSAVGRSIPVFGVTEPVSGMPNRIFMGIVDPYINPETNEPLIEEVTFYVQMWY